MEENKSVVCPDCNGLGYTAEHDPCSWDENGEHDCMCGCPVQVQCEKCRATGKIEVKVVEV